jgi:hypothetical protein
MLTIIVYRLIIAADSLHESLLVVLDLIFMDWW